MKHLLLLAFIFLVGCATQSQNTYFKNEAGQVRTVVFGTIVDIRPIEIKGENTGTGALVGGVAGAGAGSQFGSGDGQVAALIAGAIIGAVAGSIAEQAMQDQDGLDITVTTENGDTVTVSQYFKKDEPRYNVGQRVMVQTQGQYNRVLPADHLPEAIKRPKKIEVVD